MQATGRRPTSSSSVPCRTCTARRCPDGTCPECGGQRVQCRECGRWRSARRVRRGLCRKCHGNPDARQRHPHTGWLAKLGTESPRERDFDGPAPEPPPYAGEPGADKVSVLEERARNHQSLFRRDEPSEPLSEHAYRFVWLWKLLAEVDPSILDDLQTAAAEQTAPAEEVRRKVHHTRRVVPPGHDYDLLEGFRR